ncbi:MAG: uncharacterized protein JWM58_2042 [Rhizobium sp.]|nr:uncharacterized protein [Rhizobium sp.]
MYIIEGAETQVNTYVDGNQYLPQITALSGGGWVVNWQSISQDGDGWGVYQQAYAADGNPVGTETRVNTYVTGEQRSPQITALSGGGWVVSWTSLGQDGSSYGVYQQAYAADGDPVGAETRVNTYVTNEQFTPQITALPNGGWVVAWESVGQDSFGLGVYQQAYAANGAPVGIETRVNTYVTSEQFAPQITALSNGGWVVAWQSYQDGDGTGVYQQAFAADGDPVGTETRVNTYVTDAQYAPKIAALSGGGWVVTWWSSGQDGGGLGVYQRAYAANGTPVGTETRVNTYLANDQSYPDITALSGGGWVVTWMSFDQDGDDSGVYQQVYAANGAPVGTETRVNTYLANNQSFPEITALSGGGWVVTWWSTDQDGDGLGVYQQAFAANGDPAGSETRVNTHITGHQSSPQITALSDGGWVITWASSDQDGSIAGVYQKAFHINNDPTGAASAILAHGAEDQVYTVKLAELLAGFADADAGDTLSISGLAASNGAMVTDLGNGSYEIAPVANSNGVVTLSYTVTDGKGGIAATQSVTFDAVNDAPTGAAKTVAILEDTSYSFAPADFGFADLENGFAGVTIAELQGNGGCTLNGIKVAAGQFIAATDLSHLVWKPTKNSSGDDLGGFLFSVKDNGGTAHGGVDTSAATYRMSFDVVEAVDRIVGTRKADRLSGTQGGDILDGKAGNDRLTGKQGDDRLTGGTGVDTVAFRTGDGRDMIMDFAAKGRQHDVLDLSDLASVTGFKDLMQNHVGQQGGHVLIDGLDGDEILLKNVKIANLDAGDFLF